MRRLRLLTFTASAVEENVLRNPLSFSISFFFQSSGPKPIGNSLNALRPKK
jgi:hypothetical protein